MDIRTMLLAILGLEAIIFAEVVADTEAKSLRGKNKSDLTSSPSLSPVVAPTSPPTFAIANPKIVSSIGVTHCKSYVAEINQFRRHLNPSAASMRYVTCNEALAGKLVSWTEHINPAWFFQRGNIPGPDGGNHSYNGFNLMQMEPFATEFPGRNFVIHDTCTTPQKCMWIIGWRLGQASYCINFSQCNPNIWSDFESCGHPLVLAPSQRCSWATQYSPRLAIDSLSDFACVIFKQHGPNAPAGQPWSFFCYGDYIKKNNDVPYKIGKPCSDCPPEMPRCYAGLCGP